MTRRDRWALGALCAVAVLLRVGLAWRWPSAFPDETFQYLEQAYRLLTGRGLVPWEYVVGARAWLIPALIAPVLKLGMLVSPAPAVYLGVVTDAMALLAAGGVVAAFALGQRASGRTHAWLAAGLAAGWCELVALSPHVLADTLAAVPLIAALALVYRVESPSRGRWIAAGLLFGLAFVVRIQLGPAIAVAMLALLASDARRRFLPMAIGFAIPLAGMGVADWIALGAPFRSVLTYVRVNTGGIADVFGVSPAIGYVATELSLWGVAAVPIVVTAAIGARKLPLVAVTAGVVFVTFSLVPHKEYRFIYPALPLLFTLCGVGTADLVAGLAKRLRSAALAGVALGWAGLSALTLGSAAMREQLQQGDGWLAAMVATNADPGACGLGVSPADLWFMTGRVRLRTDIDLWDGSDAAKPDAGTRYDRLVVETPDAKPDRIGAFTRQACFGDNVCLYARSGGCTAGPDRLLRADPPPELAAILRRMGLD